MEKVLALVTARGGSKGIPRKNVRLIAGKPLIAWTIEAALQTSVPLRVVCSTDDEEIASVASSYGADVPFMRPSELATDEASSVDVALHAVHSLEGPFSHLLLLQPTSPLRTSQDICAALDLALYRSAPAVVGVTLAATHPFLTYGVSSLGVLEPFCETQGQSLRRQDLPEAFVLNGAIYVVQVESLEKFKTFFPQGTLPYVMPPERSFDIDDLETWSEAEAILNARGA